MNTTEARATIKAINRWVRRTRPFEGGRQFGVDWPTWSACYPQTAQVFLRSARAITGRDGLFMPRFP